MSDLDKIRQLAEATRQFISKERSDFQIEHFVVGQFDTPEMQFRQILMEAQVMIHKIRLAELNRERTLIKLQELDESDKPLDKIEAEEIRQGMVLEDSVVAGAKRELAFLAELYDRYPKFTQDDIEAAQPAYWQLRLQRQADLDRAAIHSGVSVGNLSSLLNAKMIEGENLLEIER